MRQEDIQTKIDIIVDNLEKLGTLRAKTYKDFISDFRNIDSALYILQTSIQALLDKGTGDFRVYDCNGSCFGVHRVSFGALPSHSPKTGAATAPAEYNDL